MQCSQYTDNEGVKKSFWRVQVDWVEFCGSANPQVQPVQQNIDTTADVPKITSFVPADAFVPADVDLADEDLPF